jgi:microcompartment protein CcmL/EutN
LSDELTAPALALLEVASLARGVAVADAVAKRATITFLECGPVSPGKYLILFCGGVAEADESLRAGIAVAGDSLIDRLFLPFAHEQLLPAIRAGVSGLTRNGEADEAAGVVELLSVSAALRSADAACKAADVRLEMLQLARGIGGKAWFILRGELESVEASVSAATEAAGEGLLAGAEIIARPHSDLHGTIL